MIVVTRGGIRQKLNCTDCTDGLGLFDGKIGVDGNNRQLKDSVPAWCNDGNTCTLTLEGIKTKFLTLIRKCNKI